MKSLLQIKKQLQWKMVKENNRVLKMRCTLPNCCWGNAWALSRAERKLGIESDLVIFKSNWLNYKYDKNLHLENITCPIT